MFISEEEIQCDCASRDRASSDSVKCQFYTRMNDESPRKSTERRKGAYKFPIPHRYLPDDPISFRYIRNTSSTAVARKDTPIHYNERFEVITIKWRELG